MPVHLHVSPSCPSSLLQHLLCYLCSSWFQRMAQSRHAQKLLTSQPTPSPSRRCFQPSMGQPKAISYWLWRSSRLANCRASAPCLKTTMVARRRSKQEWRIVSIPHACICMSSTWFVHTPKLHTCLRWRAMDYIELVWCRLWPWTSVYVSSCSVNTILL